jgi:hypothetical protein
MGAATVTLALAGRQACRAGTDARLLCRASLANTEPRCNMVRK